LGEKRIELIEFGVRSIIVRKSGGTFQLTDDWVKRAVGVLWRAEIAQARV
jgi:hypothetical protein